MNTEKLYLDEIKNAYNTRFSAKVISIIDNKLVLDRTLFYPLGGGQNWDLGYIDTDNGKIEISEVRGRGVIEHYISGEHNLTIGDEVIGNIDWHRRYSHMRMHTAQHLMSGLAYEIFNGVRTVGNQIHSTHSRIDFNPISFDQTMLDELSSSANELINQSIEITNLTMNREQINAIMPEDRTNMNLLPKSVKNLRVVKIGENIDLCPCAGTHVTNLEEVGSVNIISKKSKGKGTQRVTYELGEPIKTISPNLDIV